MSFLWESLSFHALKWGYGSWSEEVHSSLSRHLRKCVWRLLIGGGDGGTSATSSLADTTLWMCWMGVGDMTMTPETLQQNFSGNCLTFSSNAFRGKRISSNAEKLTGTCGKLWNLLLLRHVCCKGKRRGL